MYLFFGVGRVDTEREGEGAEEVSLFVKVCAIFSFFLIYKLKCTWKFVGFELFWKGKRKAIRIELFWKYKKKFNQAWFCLCVCVYVSLNKKSLSKIETKIRCWGFPIEKLFCYYLTFKFIFNVRFFNTHTHTHYISAAKTQNFQGMWEKNTKK